MFEDLRKCCSSCSKEITLEALKAWKILIENQRDDDWKQNEICYTAVQPLLTKKFHPLYRDVEVSEKKLNLMWLAVRKTQHLIHLEGPQYVLEVFIRSCLSWLSCSFENDSHFQDLILQLIHSLFSMEIKIEGRIEEFPSLTCEILKSNRLFCRMVSDFIEIFIIWSKIRDKTELLSIWNLFLDHCERCFKYIPISVWHSIFKLVDNVCADEKESLKNKIILLHKSATCLKSAISNSKFIDCSKFLTTPAEALLKILIELCMNCKDENIDFEMFMNCHDISYTLCSRNIDALDHEFCINLLSKVENIDVKPLLWGIWCGLTKHFSEQLNANTFEQFNKIEMRLFRKLRAVAANFDLDKPFLNENSFPTIESCFNFLKMNNTCVNCLSRNDIVENDTVENDIVENDIVENDIVENDIVENDIVENDIVENDIVENDIVENDVVENDIVENDIVENDIIEQDVSENNLQMEFSDQIVNDLWHNFLGNFNSDLITYINISVLDFNSKRNEENFTDSMSAKRYGLKKHIILKRILTVSEYFSSLTSLNLAYSKEILEIPKSEYSQKKDIQGESYLEHNFRVIRSTFRLFRPFAINFESAACKKNSTPLHIKIVIETLSVRLRFSILLDKSIVGIFKSSRYKIRHEQFFPLRKLIYSYGERENVKLFADLVSFRKKMKILYGIDFYANLNHSSVVNESLTLLLVLLFMILYINRKSADDYERVMADHIKCFQEKEYPLSVRLSTLAKSIISYTSDKVSNFLPRNEKNVTAKASRHLDKNRCKINDHEKENLFIHDIILSVKFNNKILNDKLHTLQNVDKLKNKNNSSKSVLTKKVQDKCAKEISHNPRTFRRKEENGVTKYFLRKKNLSQTYTCKSLVCDNEIVNINDSKGSAKVKADASHDKKRIKRKQTGSTLMSATKISKNCICQKQEKFIKKCSSSVLIQNKSKNKSKKSELAKDNSVTCESYKANKRKTNEEDLNKKNDNTTRTIEKISRKSLTCYQNVSQQKSSCLQQISKDKLRSLRRRPLPAPSQFDSTEWCHGNDKIRRKNNIEFNCSGTKASIIENKSTQNIRRKVSEQNGSQNNRFAKTSRGKETESNKSTKKSNDLHSLNENLHLENANANANLGDTNISKQNSDSAYPKSKELTSADHENFKPTNAEVKEKCHSYELSLANDNNNGKRKNLKRKNCTNIDNLRDSSNSAAIPYVQEEVVEVVNDLVSTVEKWRIETPRFQNHSPEKENLTETMNNELIVNIKCEDSSQMDQFLPDSSFLNLAEPERSGLSSEKHKTTLDNVTSTKKLKLENTESQDTNNSGKTEESFLRERNGKRTASNVTEDASKFSEPADEAFSTKTTKPSVQKYEPNVIYNRGSRMLALISDSPKIEHFHDSSPLLKQQVKKPPNVDKNSRASKMLALLPGFQESSFKFEHNLTEEVSEKRTEARDEDNSNCISVRSSLPNNTAASSSVTVSPRLSQPTLQRRSIRFDDEKNETVTYFTDSPPCQIIKRRMNLRSSDKIF